MMIVGRMKGMQTDSTARNATIALIAHQSAIALTTQRLEGIVLQINEHRAGAVYPPAILSKREDVTMAFEEMSNLRFAAKILQKKLDRLQNPYTPMASKLRHTIDTLLDLDRPRNANCWHIKYIDETGNNAYSRDISDTELLRIGELIAEGFVSGEIMAFESEGEQWAL